MTYCCSQCNFTSQFESALLMHQQLYHESSKGDRYPELGTSNVLLEKSKTVPQVSPPRSPFSARKSKGFRLPGRTSSATRLFNNLKARISRSKMLFAHPEEPHESTISVREPGLVPSECTSKALKVDSTVSSVLTTCLEDSRRETFGCHLCSFEADRITVLDRHLLNHHKIGLENLLKLVMAKTKDGLTEDTLKSFGVRQPYYKLQDEIIEEGEFIIETVAPKIKILKHASTNTEKNHKFEDFKAIANQIEKLFKLKQDGGHNIEQDGGGNFMDKLATLNECMCKFVDSSNTLKMVLNKELDSKANVKEHMSGNEPVFNLGLGGRDTSREWERAHSEKLERSRKYPENSRCDKGKFSADSFYF